MHLIGALIAVVVMVAAEGADGTGRVRKPQSDQVDSVRDAKALAARIDAVLTALGPKPKSPLRRSLTTASFSVGSALI